MGDSEMGPNTEKRAITQKCGLKLGLAVFGFLCFILRYTKFGGPIPQRPIEDLAFSVASTMDEQILDGRLLVSSLPLAMIMMPQLTNMVHVFNSKSGCAAFLTNYDTKSSATVTFQNM
ncbi:hypothetical protein HYC85_022919 [Camellia sinensis]|uniref:Uncharacterized protein n=1 Tax=Camellia sinensis TaxID=4442 RepID=A0A7J7GD53_CAMSI|nr:hypothetical protein HYC85_022919 [Camellia sinensis]